MTPTTPVVAPPSRPFMSDLPLLPRKFIDPSRTYRCAYSGCGCAFSGPDLFPRLRLQKVRYFAPCGHDQVAHAPRAFAVKGGVK